MKGIQQMNVKAIVILVIIVLVGMVAYKRFA